MGKVSFHRLARRELNDGAQYYELESSGLGVRFLGAVEACVSAIVEFPDAGSNLPGNVQRRLVAGFPYGVLYRVKPNGIRVLAVMNLKRRPMYWVGRE